MHTVRSGQAAASASHRKYRHWNGLQFVLAHFHDRELLSSGEGSQSFENRLGRVVVGTAPKRCPLMKRAKRHLTGLRVAKGRRYSRRRTQINRRNLSLTTRWHSATLSCGEYPTEKRQRNKRPCRCASWP